MMQIIGIYCLPIYKLKKEGKIFPHTQGITRHQNVQLNLVEQLDQNYFLFRAKLLHDAWNLAYAGDLSFATAFNMTLFMKYERDHIVWNPVFTLIDHIGAHIDMSSVHKKFQVIHLI